MPSVSNRTFHIIIYHRATGSSWLLLVIRLCSSRHLPHDSQQQLRAARKPSTWPTFAGVSRHLVPGRNPAAGSRNLRPQYLSGPPDDSRDLHHTMSPILKRDVAETVRQARRLAAAAGLRDYDEYGEYELDPVGVSKVAAANTRSGGAVASGSAEWDRDRERTDHERGREVTEGRSTSLDLDHGESYDNAPLLRAHDDSESVTTTMSAIEGKWGDLKGLLFSVSRDAPSTPPAMTGGYQPGYTAAFTPTSSTPTMLLKDCSAATSH